MSIKEIADEVAGLQAAVMVNMERDGTIRNGLTNAYHLGMAAAERAADREIERLGLVVERLGCEIRDLRCAPTATTYCQDCGRRIHYVSIGHRPTLCDSCLLRQ